MTRAPLEAIVVDAERGNNSRTLPHSGNLLGPVILGTAKRYRHPFDQVRLKMRK